MLAFHDAQFYFGLPSRAAKCGVVALVFLIISASANALETPEIESRDSVSEELGVSPELPPLEEVSNDADTPGRAVRVEFQKAVGAIGYEVEVIQEKRTWSEPMHFEIPASEKTLRLRLSPGKYQVKTRSRVDRILKSNWTPYMSFWVGFRPIEKAYPAEADLISPKSSDIEVLSLEWPKETDAGWYIVQVRDASGKFIRNAIVSNTWLKVELPINAAYSWRVIPLAAKEDANRILRQKNPKKFANFKIIKPDESMRKTEFAIAAAAKAEKYEFEVVSINHDNDPEPPSFFFSYEPKFLGRLPPGEYELRVRSKMSDGSNTEWSTPTHFFVERFEPPAITATKAQTIKPTDDEASKVLLQWKKDASAAYYRVFVFSQQDVLLLTEKTETPELWVKLPHEAKYKWYAKPYSLREPASDEPDPKKASNDFSISHYIKLALSSAEESSQFYGWLRQLSSQESYTGLNYDNNAKVRQKLFGGETELAFGYWFRELNVGFLASASSGNFRLRGANYNYANSAFLVGYRKILENADRLRIWLGLGQKENPEILDDPFSNDVIFSKVKSSGPIAQFSYLHAYNQLWGGQFWGSVYQSQNDRGTPNGLPQEAKTSFRLGLLASYNWKPDQRWLLGYTYKVENFSYATTDPIGIPNSGKLEGHYFSLMFEFALQEKVK